MKTYTMGDEKVHALDGIDLEIFRGEYVSIMGPSGSGKSTLFNMIGSLDTPTEGQVMIDGTDVPRLSSRQRAYVRCAWIGYIFQSFNLIPVLTAQQNVALSVMFSGQSKEDASARALVLLESVGLGDRAHHKPNELSGGQQQRVAIARALANTPRILLADDADEQKSHPHGGDRQKIVAHPQGSEADDKSDCRRHRRGGEQGQRERHPGLGQHRRGVSAGAIEGSMAEADLPA